MSARTRILAAYLALASATAAIVVVGAGFQPHYGSLPAAGGTAYADLRSTPRAAGWTLDIDSLVAPEVPAECVVIRAGDVDAGHELVDASVPASSPTGRFSQCTRYAEAVASRVVMVDPETGRMLWYRDLGATLGMGIGSIVWHAAPALHRVVIGVDGVLGNELMVLDTATGRTTSSVGVFDADEVINFGVAGELMLSASPQASGDLTTYTLRRVDDVERPVWTQTLSSSVFPQLLDDRLLVPDADRTVSVDGRSGATSTWPQDLSRRLDVDVVGDRVVALTTPHGVGPSTAVELYRADGSRVWSYPATTDDSVSVSRTCILLETPSSYLTCLDPSTGRPRWTADLPGIVQGTVPGSTTADIEIVRPILAGDESLTIDEVDAATGRVRFATRVPRGSLIVGQARTTGYALNDGTESGKALLTAFDLASGRRLWSTSLSTTDGAALGVWCGRPVVVSASGIARELVASAAPRLAEAPDAVAHGMLDG